MGLQNNFWKFDFLEIFFSNHVVENQENNLAILGLFLNLQDYFKNRGLIFETSDSIFCDLPNELFHIKKIFFEKKIKFSKVILKSHETKVSFTVIINI